MQAAFTLVLLFCKTLVQQRHDVHDKFQRTGCPACCRTLSHQRRGAVMLMSPDNCPQAALLEALLPWSPGTWWLDPLGQFPHHEICLELGDRPGASCPTSCMPLHGAGRHWDLTLAAPALGQRAEAGCHSTASTAGPPCVPCWGPDTWSQAHESSVCCTFLPVPLGSSYLAGFTCRYPGPTML